MESRMTLRHFREGSVLVMVLIITAIGLLFGAGALLLFRFQCQLRIDRQHELEKIYAVRSTLNFLKPPSVDINSVGKPFRYLTGSGRDLEVIVKPVERIFPRLGKVFSGYPREHLTTDSLNVENYSIFPCPFANPNVSYSDPQYNGYYDYEYGAEYGQGENVDLRSCITNNMGIAFTDLAAANNERWWVNIGMRDTGGWLQEDYGRRYFFWLRNFVENDIIRLCIIRNVTNENNVAGCKHGWPLRNGEMALVFEIVPVKSGSAGISFSIWKDGRNNFKTYLDKRHFPVEYRNRINSTGYMGLQLTRSGVYLFQVHSLMSESDNSSYNLSSSGYVFSSEWSFSADYEAYEYFAKYYSEKEKCWKIYDGKDRDKNGKRIPAPELRAVVEVEAASKQRPDVKTSFDVVSDFRVTPAYQYDVFLEHPHGITNRATVAQKIISSYDQYNAPHAVMTYDTHGTENKGFRKDEREAER